jgi:hypothetical protein
MRLQHIVFLFITLVVFSFQPKACTVAVISGKYTKDGRPLLWKNRDTWAVNNSIMYFSGEKYEYMGLVNSHDKTGKSVWIGHNSAGFAIMNSASYNLNLGDTTKLSGLEGKLIKEALGSCATVDDFEKFLDNMKKPTRLEANFGVIDAVGGAAMFEVNNKGYVKFDANDPRVAPFGYIIRANYSFTGSYGKESSGYIRYNTANKLFYNAMATNSFDAGFIIQDVTRSLKHSLVDIDLYRRYGNIAPNTPTYTFFHDFIPRRSSASSCVIQGVKKDENPELSTLWSVVGFPLTSIAVPTWIKGKNKFPQVLKRNDKLNDSPVCNAALTLKKQVFPIRWGKYASKYYLNINALVNSKKTGITQKIRPYENDIFKITNRQLEKWRTDGGINTGEMDALYGKINEIVKECYLKEFGLEL